MSSLRLSRRGGILLFSAALLLQAKDPVNFRAGEYQSDEGTLIRYRLYVPENLEGGAKYPLVIWLHDILGIGLFNREQISGSDAVGAKHWTRKEIQAHHPAFVLAPQCSLGSFWVNFLTRQPSQKLRTVPDLVADLMRQYPIDPKRLYVAGQSMGGYGVWALIEMRPDLFAAAVPVAGAGIPLMAPLIVNTPVWAFHCSRDRIVNVKESRIMIGALRAIGGTPKYTEYPRLGHTNSCWSKSFQEPGLVDWVFAQHRTD